MPTAKEIDVYLLPALVEPAALAGKTVVVIDVLRATTTIVHALAAEAVEVVPFLDVEDARRLAEQIGERAVWAANAAACRFRVLTWAIRRRNTRAIVWAGRRSSSRRPMARGPWSGANWPSACSRRLCRISRPFVGS